MNNEWEKEFDERFPHNADGIYDLGEIKTFITTLLAEERRKVVEEIGKKLPQAFGWEVVKGGREQVRDDPAHEFGYDVALFEIHKMLNLLSNSHKGHE